MWIDRVLGVSILKENTMNKILIIVSLAVAFSGFLTLAIVATYARGELDKNYVDTLGNNPCFMSY